MSQSSNDLRSAVQQAWFETGVMSTSIQAADHIIAAIAREAVAARRPGTWDGIASGLDEYHAVNLREALKLVPDTGDWHGSLRAACEIVLRDHPEAKPNQTADQIVRVLPALGLTCRCSWSCTDHAPGGHNRAGALFEDRERHGPGVRASVGVLLEACWRRGRKL